MKRFVVLIALLAAIAWGGMSYLAPWYKGPGGDEKKVVEVTVSRGDTLAAAARKLEAAGVIASADRFLTLVKLFGSDAPIKAGEYGFYPARAWQAHLATMQSGVPIQRFIAIPEGTPSILVHERLMAEPLLTGTVPVPAEGSVLPDSYSFERGEARRAVLDRMQAAMKAELARLWAARKPGIAVTTPQQAVTLASIVEKETGVPAERRTVAGVYTNRLKLGMPLQADPTVIYPVTKGKPLGRRIRRSELQARNDYNTYAMAGLPVGPIANPGRESIAAVLDPASTKALYFVADGSGGHIFAETLEQHNANVSKWYALRRSKGEM
jgi:UPF0755 protein